MPGEREEDPKKRKELDERFEALYTKYYRYSVIYLWRMGFREEEEASDLAQQAFLRVYRGMESFRGGTEAAEVAFIKTTSRRVGLNKIREKHVRPQEVPMPPSLEDSLSQGSLNGDEPSSVEEKLAEEELRVLRRRRLLDAILDLPLRQRNCLTLSLGGRSHQDIAEALHISAEAVKSCLRDARRRLRQKLAEEPTGIDWPEDSAEDES